MPTIPGVRRACVAGVCLWLMVGTRRARPLFVAETVQTGGKTVRSLKGIRSFRISNTLRQNFHNLDSDHRSRLK